MARKRREHRNTTGGSVYEVVRHRKSGPAVRLWVAAFSYMDSSGKRRRVVAYAADNESAKARLDEIKARPEVKARLPKAEGTVGKLIDDWLTNEVAANLRASTAATYRATFRKHIEPSDLAKVFLAKVRSTDVDGLYRLLLTSGVSSRTRRKVHDLLTSAFTSALEKRQIASDPMIGIKRPTYAAPSVKALGPKQIAALIEAAHGDRLEALYLVALFGGLREGELLALRWGDVDLKGGTIFVRASLQDTGLSKKKGGAPARVIAGTKTEGSERPVSLPKIAADALRRHRKLVARDVPERALVFPNDDGGPIWRQNLLRRSFYPLLKRAGLYADDKPLLTFHGLRHVHGTELFRAGIHPKIVQERLGHSRVQITLDTYSSSVPSLQGAAVQALDAAYPSRRRRASATRVATRNPQMGATPE